MNAFSKILTAAVLVAGASAPAFAQLSDAETTTGSVRIIQPIQLNPGNALSFGTVVRPSSGSNTFTIAIGADDVVMTGGGNGAVITTSGTRTRASYTAAGEGGQAFTVSVSALSMTGPGAAIPVTLTRSITSGNLTGTLGTTGAFPGTTLYVGGAFTIDDTQQSGDYSGTFSTTLAYN